ncbi:allergen Tha p 1-like [Homalodisca vitripennis]|uniref:allergen Tha p 1-like n=1 Tax=Homalodisca vitripennis TaxID=197043 RepID=UPI001EECD90B|nr:allergen Tha p 1-like [Homalodisca vitripennis]KAG8326955.1 hypothetical protein J6590_029711 [Homalodisca vitripennis]
MSCPWIGRSPVPRMFATINSRTPLDLGQPSKMSSVVVVLLVCTLAIVTAGPPAPHTLEEAAHHFDKILNNTRSRENYIRCFLDKGICNKDSLSIKRILTEALAGNCTSCTPIQRLGADRFFQYLQERQPDTYTRLTTKYHPAGAQEDDDDESDDSEDDDDEGEKGVSMKMGGSGLREDGGNVGHNNTKNSTNTSSIDIIF